MPEAADDPASAIAAVVREEWGRVVAALVRDVRDLDLAEDAAQEALAVALERWPVDGMPERPGAWITTVARRKAIDRLRRQRRGSEKEAQLATLTAREQVEEEPVVDETALDDDQLRLIFTCCHPALSTEAQVALTLRTVCGLTTPEIARAFVVSESTLAQRLVRAKRKIKVAGVPFRVPPDHLLPDRLSAVLAITYLVFNQGYSDLSRPDLSVEAVRLGRRLAELMPDEPEVLGLLALMLLTEARRSARLSAEGELVVLQDQDRTLWDPVAIAEGLALVERALRMHRPGPYQIQAAIAGVHSSADTAAETDWFEIAALYGELASIHPTPVVELNRAVALSMAYGPEAGLESMQPLAEELAEYQPFHAAQADLLARQGRRDEAARAYRRAIELTLTEPERHFLERRLAGLNGADPA